MDGRIRWRRWKTNGCWCRATAWRSGSGSSLARDPAEGGVGIAAALQTELPSRFIWQAYRAVLGPQAVPAASPFDKPLLVWRLMRLLPALLAEAVFVPLRRFLADDADLRKRHQLAERLADLFDQYQVYRADWLAAWAAGRTCIVARPRRPPRRCPKTCAGSRAVARAARRMSDAAARPAASGQHRLLAGRTGASEAAQAALELEGARAPAGLPRRLVVFGISSLPQQSLEVLARWRAGCRC